MRLRIVHKMLLAFSLYLAIACCFGLFVYTQVGRIMERQALVEIADDIKEELLELRRNEKNYIIRHDPVYLEKIDQTAQQLELDLRNFRPHLLSAFDETKVNTLMEAVTAYASFIDDFGRNYHDTTALTGELRTIGKKIEHRILQNNNLFMRDILEIRLIEKNYIFFLNSDYLRQLKKEVAALHARLTAKGIKCLLFKNYLDTAEKLSAHHEIESQLLAGIGRQANVMESLIIILAEKERENIAKYVINTKRTLYVALIALAVFGLVLSFILSKAIMAPLQKLETTVRKINDGEFELRLDTGGDVETASLQKSFNTMLDTLDLARESLTQTIQLLQDKSVQLIESEKLASIGILASGVAHEINNPLANISLTAETLKDCGKDITEDEKKELINDIIVQTERASGVVNNLLGYTRSVKNNKTDIVNIIHTLKQAHEMVAHEMKLHDIHLQTNLPQTVFFIKGNKGRLEQVFVNIMLNSIQAMDKNGQLTLHTETDPEQKNIIIGIEDTGPGIPSENLKNIFDPFFTTKSAGEGTGLGLYVSYGIIQEHDGNIDVQSTMGQGTVFRITLPLIETIEEKDA